MKFRAEEVISWIQSAGLSLDSSTGELLLYLCRQPEARIGACTSEQQLLLIDYEMLLASKSGGDYTPRVIADRSIRWPHVLSVAEALRPTEARERILTAAALFSNATRDGAFRELSNIGTEGIFSYIHAFSYLPTYKRLHELAKNILARCLVVVPEGAFIYGNTPEQQAEELQRAYPIIGEGLDMQYWLRGEFGQQTLDTPSFSISIHPITNLMYKRFRPEHCYPDGYEDHPVVSVDWHSAIEYANWCDCDLPTEFEWEKAIRGNDGRTFAWGNTPDISRCNVLQSNIGGTSAVGQFDNESIYGCLDGNGNVWEWTKSDYDPGSWRKAIRGGSWLCTMEFARCATRCWDDPQDRSVAIGFRVVSR